MAKNILKKLAPPQLLRFMDNNSPSDKVPTPIEFFESLPIVSIEAAVQPLIPFVADIIEMMSEIKRQCNKAKDNLTIDETAAIMLYSQEWIPLEHSFYIILNNTLRSENDELLKPWHLYLKLFISALEKLPSISQTLYRGVKKDLSAYYPQGKTFIWWAFSSCTTSIQVLQSEKYLGKTGPRTLFTIDSNSGKDIQKYSLVPTEDEVLLVAARKFQVISCLDSGNDLFIIQIKEIESDFPLLGSSHKKHILPPLKNIFSEKDDENSTNSPLDVIKSLKPSLPKLPPPPRFPPPPKLPSLSHSSH